MKKYVLLATAIVFGTLAHGGPGTITYQGNLRAGSGTPLPNGTFSMRFTIHDDPVADSAKWEELETGVEVIDGSFSVLLGDGTPFGTLLNDYSHLWLEIAIDLNHSDVFEPNEVYSPRQKLASSTWALDSDRLQGRPASQFQLRVTGTASPGHYITAINEDGTVATRPDQVGSGDITAVNAGAGLTGGGTAGDVSMALAFGGTGSQDKAARADHFHPGGGSYWSLGGNGGTTTTTNFLGTTDNVPLELRANGSRVLRLEPTTISPNVVGGYAGNAAYPGVWGATLGGGGSRFALNRVTDFFGTVGGGAGNTAGDSAGTVSDISAATVAGGSGNTAAGPFSTVAGGLNNIASGDSAVVAGGGANSATGLRATVGGGFGNSAQVDYATIAGGGRTDAADPATGNRVTDEYGAIGGGGGNHAGDADAILDDAPYATVAGGEGNTAGAAWAAVAGGRDNVTSGAYGVIGGGYLNSAPGLYAIVGGGLGNAASARFASIAGGGRTTLTDAATANRATDQYSVVGGGGDNQAGNANGVDTDATFATVGGGKTNTAGGQYATVAGGSGNSAQNQNATVAGGNTNVAGANESTVGGGFENRALGSGSMVAGGVRNTANGPWAGVSGGTANNAIGIAATVGGGQINSARADHATVAGGRNNTLTAAAATIGGGAYNQASAAYATIAGGGPSDPLNPDNTSNRVTDEYGVVGGGAGNQAGDNAGVADDAAYATVGGGLSNVASARASTVPGGEQNEASGFASFAAGARAKAAHDGSFVWADASLANFASSNRNQFLIRAANGVGIGTNTPSAALDVVGDVESSGEYTYSPARTYYKQLSPCDFTIKSTGENDNVHFDEDGYAYFKSYADGIVEMSAGVDLPDGAVIRALDMYYMDNSGATGVLLVADFRKRDQFSSTSVEVAHTEVNTTQAYANPNVQVVTDITILNALVDNRNAQYHVALGFVVSAASTWARFYGARVTYTIYKVAP